MPSGTLLHHPVRECERPCKKKELKKENPPLSWRAGHPVRSPPRAGVGFDDHPGPLTAVNGVGNTEWCLPSPPSPHQRRPGPGSGRQPLGPATALNGAGNTEWRPPLPSLTTHKKQLPSPPLASFPAPQSTGFVADDTTSSPVLVRPVERRTGWHGGVSNSP